MKLKVKTTVSSGTLYVRLIDSQNNGIGRKLIGKDEYEFQVVPGEEYAFEWYVWTSKSMKIKISVKLLPSHGNFEDFDIEDNYDMTYNGEPLTRTHVLIPIH